jgi:hypothetical protein
MVATSVVLAGCSNSRIPVQTSVTAPDDTELPPTSADATGATPSTDSAGAAQASAGGDLARRLGLQEADLAAPWAGMKVQLSPNGDKLTGQSLDNCGFVFPSERYRVARRMTGIYDKAGKGVGVFNEVVVYDSDGHASQALREWHASVGNCHKGTVLKPTTKNGPKTRIDVETTATDPTLPIADNTVTSLSTTVLGLTHTRLYGTFLLQARGSIVDVVLAVSPTPLTAASTSGLSALAKATGQRLANS